MTREQRLARTALLMSPAQMERLAHAHVMLLGLGGVGGHAAAALARGGVGRMTILDLTAIDAFYLPDSPVPIPEDATVVVDAIDTVSAKLHLARVCRERGVPLISCMGMGNRLDPAQIRVGDIFETSGCPLCRVMRQGLRKLGVPSLRCVYSLEPACHPRAGEGAEQKGGHPAPGSVSFVPSVAGIYLAAEAIRLIAGEG